MIFNFKKKNVFISGGTHGIGLECSLRFAQLGANIITFSRDKKKINNLIKKLGKFKKIDYLVEQGDILNKEFPKNFSHRVLKKFKSVDILIHNVGGGGRWGKDDISSTPTETWYEVFGKNNFGLIEFSKYFLPNMVKKKWGRIITISSICGYEVSKDDRPWFSGAKSFQNAVIKTLSKKHIYTRKNITFNSVLPGPIFIPNTGWDKLKKNYPEKYKKDINNIPTGRIGKPEDVVNSCIFLSSKYASYINGVNLIIDGGITNKI